MILSVAWRNIWRNKVRSLVVLMAVASGMLGGIFAAGVMKGLSDQRVREAIAREVSHFQIHDSAFLEDYELKYIIPKSEDIEKGLIYPGIKACSPRLRFTAMAATATSSTGVMVYGVDPEKERAVSEISKMISDTSGHYLSQKKSNEVVVGAKLASKLKLRLRSKLILTFQDGLGNLSGAALRVAGIYRTNNSMFDEMNIFVNRKDIAPLLGLQPNDCHEIAILLTPEASKKVIGSYLEKLAPGLLIRSWEKIDPVLGMLGSMMDLFLYIFLGIILLALGFGIVNTMMMVVLERTRELGMLSAIGMTRGRLFRMIMFESVMLCLLGALVGMTGAAALIHYYSVKGIDLTAFAEGLQGIGYPPVIYTELQLKYYLIIAGMTVMTGILAAIYPGRRALRLKPAEAIRAD